MRAQLFKFQDARAAAKTESVTEKIKCPSENTQWLPEGIPLSRMSVTGQIEIPNAIREKMGFRPGDLLAFVIDEGALVIKKGKIKVEFE